MTLPDTMKTIEIREHGGPDVLEPGERPLPVPAEGEVLVKIIAAGVNGPDIVQRRGHYPPPAGASDLLGLEVSGEVVALGDGVERWKVGDQICALTNGGGYAEYVTIASDQCLPIPQGVDPVDAAGLCETLFTMWSNFFTNHAADKGLLFLVHGGAGGIGSTAIQLGAAVGMRVFTTCSGDDKAFCESLGATRAIDYLEEDFVEIVKAAGGANLILDIRGGGYVARNIAASAPDGRIVQLAFNAGSKVDVNLMPVMLKRLTITGSTLRPRPPEFKAKMAAELERFVWPWFAKDMMKTNTFATVPLEEAQRAHEMMEAGEHRGKILLTM